MAIYRRIAEFIEKKIVDGTYSKGYMIPGENELCVMFSTSRMTVRKALDELSARGLVYKIKGRGTFVSQFGWRKEHTLKGFSQIMTEKGIEVSSIVKAFEVVEAEKDVADSLLIAEGSKVYNLKRVRLVYNEPVGIENIFLNYKLFPDFLKYDFNVNSLYKILETEYNVRLSRVEQRVSTVDISGEDAKILFKKNKGVALQLRVSAMIKTPFP